MLCTVGQGPFPGGRVHVGPLDSLVIYITSCQCVQIPRSLANKDSVGLFRSLPLHTLHRCFEGFAQVA